MPPKMINIGTAERPIHVPEHALLPESPKGREYWGKIADGSVMLPEDGLDRLLKKVDSVQGTSNAPQQKT